MLGELLVHDEQKVKQRQKKTHTKTTVQEDEVYERSADSQLIHWKKTEIDDHHGSSNIKSPAPARVKPAEECHLFVK